MGGQQFPINLSGVMVAVMLLVAALMNQPPLRSDRPPAARISAEPSGPFQDIPARIWEDPLEAVARARAVDAASQPKGSGNPAAPVAPAADAGAPATDADERNILSLYLEYLVQNGARSRLLLMPVMISGGPNPALREQRLRMRLAVHAGLATDGFLPLRSERIGNWSSPIPTTVPGQRALTLDIPFEVFKRPRQEADGQWVRDLVVVMWLNDEYVSQDLGSHAGAHADDDPWPGPLATIDDLLARIDYPSPGPPKKPGPWSAHYRSVAVRLIGPVNSDSLEPLYRELIGQPGVDCGTHYQHIDNDRDGQPDWPPVGREPLQGVFGDQPTNFAVISPLATAPQGNLTGRNDITSGPVHIGKWSNPTKDKDTCPEIGFYRTVMTDERLIAALIDELKRRGIDPEGGLGHASRLSAAFARLQALLGNDTSLLGRRDHVVLIWEWDTNYGRTLPSLFEASVRVHIRPPIDASVPVPWLHQFAYARGLDGDAPAQATSSPQDAPDLLALATGDEAGFKEPALGTNQFDYLRRMTESIALLDQSLKRNNQGSIKAFGILGNDYFDKLLILQALKERFPGHLYFTTDLDAGLLDARVFRWTRNLVIAAPYGLSVGADLQRLTPPFRHTTQTSLYLSVLHAVRGEEALLAEHAASDPPLLFEVGAEHFYRLTTPTPAPASAKLPPLQPLPDNADVRRFLSSHASSMALAVGAALGLLLLAAPALGRRARQPNDSLAAGGRASVWAERNAVWLLTLAYLILGGGWLSAAIATGEEPFAWFAGVSIWPSEIIRLFAGWVAGLCLIYGWRRVRDSDRHIAERFELRDPRSATAATRVPFRAWYRRRAESLAPPADVATQEGAEAAAATPASGTQPATAALGPGIAERPHVPGPLVQRIGRLFGDGPGLCADGPLAKAASEWQRYLPHASAVARLGRVIPMTLLFWLLSIVVVYGFIDPLTPHRGLAAWWFDTAGGLLLVGLPFSLLLFAAVDEARLCRGLLRRIGKTCVHWPLNLADAGFSLDPQARRAVDYWLTIEFIAARTAPAAHLVHLPLLVTLFLLLSLSTRFDNWNTPATVLGLIGLTVGIVLLSSNRLRGTAQGIRDRLLARLKEEVSGIEYAAAATQSEKLRELVKRIEAIDAGSYTKWYNEPVFRGLIWVLGIGIWIITEYAKLG